MYWHYIKNILYLRRQIVFQNRSNLDPIVYWVSRFLADLKQVNWYLFIGNSSKWICISDSVLYVTLRASVDSDTPRTSMVRICMFSTVRFISQYCKGRTISTDSFLFDTTTNRRASQFRVLVSTTSTVLILRRILFGDHGGPVRPSKRLGSCCIADTIHEQVIVLEQGKNGSSGWIEVSFDWSHKNPSSVLTDYSNHHASLAPLRIF